MFRLSILLIVVLTVVGSGDAQQPRPNAPECPTISVIGPSGLVGMGEQGFFSGKVDWSGETVSYRWTVSGGTIVSGQGTNTIEVKNSRGETLTATFEVLGLPDGCPRHASEHNGGLRSPTPVLIGEVVSPAMLSPAMVSKIKRSADNAPSDHVYITIHYKTGTPKKVIDSQTVGLLKKFSTAGFARSRITAAYGTADKPRIAFWLVPPGANYPTFDER